MAVAMKYYKPYGWGEAITPRMGLIEYFRRMNYRLAGYNQLGLYHDDLLYNFPDVLEAVRRLPRPIKEERDWRLIRAIQLDIKSIILPENQWPTYEDDITKGRYLEPYLKEVRREVLEQDRWNAEH